MVAHVLATCDLILVGAEAVVENGGIINKIGTYQLGIIAKVLNKPMYVLAESFKFKREFIFHQQEIKNNKTTATSTSPSSSSSSSSAALTPANSSPAAHLQYIKSELDLQEKVKNGETDNNNNNTTDLEQKCAQPHTKQQHHVPLVIKDAICSEYVDNDEYLDHKWDYTPPDFITLIFSDLGILSPSAVSDELFKLHY
eukprot:UN03232